MIDLRQSLHKVKIMTKPDPIRAQALENERTSHGFFTRSGGTSKGIYLGLNVGLGSDDERASVLENRRRVAQAMGVGEERFVTVYQVHSCDVIEVTKPWGNDERPRLDAMVSKTPGLAIGVMTADCGPVLFQDAQNGVIGAAHAGWKGATSGILENTISAMEALGAKRETITTVLGPTISRENYEVGSEFVENVISLDSKNDVYFTPSSNEGHAMFDLPGYIVDRLKASGVQASWTGNCTYREEDRFFSYRRKTHRNEADYGRQVSVIKLNS